MLEYKAPLRDIQFVLFDVLDSETRYHDLRGDDVVNRDLVNSIIEEGAKFCEQELAPLNRNGDEEGCHFDEGKVTTPKGFKEAYQRYIEGGWPSLSSDESLGGQGLPYSLGIVMNEMMGSANWSWTMYPGLSHGAIKTLEAHGTKEQQETYLTQLIGGTWTGTMCLTEPQCGTDLGLLKTKAEPNADGAYRITGTKIFISAGEHDMADNIIHIVLARLPDAPKGTKGISLFIVPKRLVNADGSLGQPNNVACGSIEKKMGIQGSSTAVMNFDGAKGYLIGEANSGLSCMFTFMNTARIGTALQGVAAAESSFQGALAYAKDRLAMRALSGPKYPDKDADPIIVHPDVRRMLLTQKVFAEGGRALVYFLAAQADIVQMSQDKAAVKEADDLMALLTPIAKAFGTESGLEAANLGVQVLGGHGFIREWGMEQIVRDTRIATLYEGTSGVQALDLLGRKVLMTQGVLLKKFTKIIHKFCEKHAGNDALAEFVGPLAVLNKEWGDVTLKIGMRAMQNKEEVGAAAFDYVMYSGYITLAYFWALMVEAAQEKMSGNEEDDGFYTAKVQSARFYFQRILPRTKGMVEMMASGADNLMTIPKENLGFYE